MTQKDFKLIADVMAGLPMDGHTSWNTYRKHTAYELARKLATTNPRFDRAKFLRACGVEAWPH